MSSKVATRKKPMTKKSIIPHFSGEVYDKYLSPTYDFLTSLSGWRGHLERKALEGLKPCKMLDVGCGTGFVLNLALKKGFDAYGVDPSEAMLKRAVREGGIPRARLSCGTAQKIPHADGTFDLVIASGSMIYEPHMADAAREMARVLKKGGRVRLVDHTTPKKMSVFTPVFYVFMHISGWLIHNFEHYFSPYFELVEHKTLARGGYLQRYDFLKR